MYVISYGNPWEGMTCVGPFRFGSEAIEWAEENVDETTWWVLPVVHPALDKWGKVL